MTDLDTEVKAVCEDCQKEQTVTFRKLKNKWVICSCGQPMIIKVQNAIPPIHTTD